MFAISIAPQSSSGSDQSVLSLADRTEASFRRSAVHATPVPIKIKASVALRLPGATQLMQLVMIIGTSFMRDP